jgi:predicted MFS family arabinose efflux permease
MLLCVLPLSYALKGKAAAAPGQAEFTSGAALRKAWRFTSYRLLVIGFFVCGFHLAFINVHMPAYLVQCGLSPEVGSWSIAVIGLFNIIGSLSSGYIGGKYPKQILLAAIYFTRAVAIGLFLLFPVTEVSAYMFAAAIGLLWLSTVPPTAALVSTFFGPRYMGLLYGIAFFSHQVGSFVGVWLGGAAYDATGSYALVWYLGILLGLASAAVHLPIRETGAAEFQARPLAA